ncbi:MAG: KAP family P-loop NTPase fold protein [Actinomycetota bacterium]
MQWDAEKLIDAFTPTSKEAPTSMTGFRDEFGSLLETLPDLHRVVVLVDDLDRCLPEAVTATLEAIKLFLSVPRMVFVLAADQDMVRDAIAVSINSANRGDRFAARYLDKIIQLPVAPWPPMRLWRWPASSCGGFTPLVKAKTRPVDRSARGSVHLAARCVPRHRHVRR